MDEEFFREMFRRPAEMEYSYHPSERVLRAYLSGALGDEWHFDREFLPKLRRADLDGDWGLSEVSLHLLTCSHCAKRVAQLREEEAAAFEERRASVLSRLRALLKPGGSWTSQFGSSRGMEKGVRITRPWPVGHQLGIGLASLSLGLPALAFGLPLGMSPLSPVNLSLFQQRLRSGL